MTLAAFWSQSRAGFFGSVWVLVGAMASSAWPASRATYYVVFRQTELDQGVLKLGDQAWWSLKDNVESAIRRHAWRCSREAFDGELGELRCWRCTLTHAGMSACFLGYLRIELRGWRQDPIRGTWSSSCARFAADLPLSIVARMAGQWMGDELWWAEWVKLPDAATCLGIYDSRRPQA